MCDSIDEDDETYINAYRYFDDFCESLIGSKGQYKTRIEKYISSLSKMLCDDYEIEMIITYKLKEVPSFNINNKTKITYLIDGGPNKDEIKKCIRRKKYFKLITELFKAVKILRLKKSRTKKALKKSIKLVKSGKYKVQICALKKLGKKKVATKWTKAKTVTVKA